MTSCGPNTQSYNFTHMYDFQDYRLTTKPEIKINMNSVYSVICNNDFSLFKVIVERAGMSGRLNDIELNCTLFIPKNSDIVKYGNDFFEFMDDGLARQILSACMLRRRIKSDIIKSSPVAYYDTKNDAMRMYVTNINSITTINNRADVVTYDLECSNGVIHIIDDLIIPTDEKFMN